MTKLWNMLSGYRSYMFVAGASIAFALKMLGILDIDTFEWILGICTAGYAASMRSAVQKTETAAAGTNV